MRKRKVAYDGILRDGARARKREPRVLGLILRSAASVVLEKQ